MKIILKSFFFFLLTFFYFSCSNKPPQFKRTLGTVCIVNLYEDGKSEIYDEIFDRLFQIDDEFNIGKKDSDISRINSNAFFEPIEVSDDIFKVISTSQLISTLTAGAFDISIEPIVSLWHINTDSPHVATQDEIDELLPLVDYTKISLDYEKKSVRLLKEGMKIDLGGIAKGFAADEIIKICKKHKVKHAVIDLGGNVFVYGKKTDGFFGIGANKFWNVGVKNPEFPDLPPVLKLSLPQSSVVTSGVYERFFEEDKKRYHHILSPKNGYPAKNNLYSVTVICENSMIADALSTAFFVLGKEKSLSLLPSIKNDLKNYFETSSTPDFEISAIFMEENHKITLSKDFPYETILLNEDWELLKRKWIVSALPI